MYIITENTWTWLYNVNSDFTIFIGRKSRNNRVEKYFVLSSIFFDSTVIFG